MKNIININRLGFYSNVLMTLFTVMTFTIAVLTPPVSGPYCTGYCLKYPYTDIISRFPRDYFWMYTAIMMFLFFIVSVICIHHSAPKEKRYSATLG